MANKQSRRTISVSRKLIDRVRKHCKAEDVPVSQFTENALLVAMGMEPVPFRQAGTKPECGRPIPKGS